ncbi:hypothetical protein D3C73_1066670 [compost metagenome]
MVMRLQIFMHVFIEEQLLQLPGLQGQGGALGQQRLLLLVGDPAAACIASVDEVICCAQPRLDLLQNRVEQGPARTRCTRKAHLLQGSRKPGRLLVGQPVY